VAMAAGLVRALLEVLEWMLRGTMEAKNRVDCNSMTRK